MTPSVARKLENWLEEVLNVRGMRGETLLDKILTNLPLCPQPSLTASDDEHSKQTAEMFNQYTQTLNANNQLTEQQFVVELRNIVLNNNGRELVAKWNDVYAYLHLKKLSTVTGSQLLKTLLKNASTITAEMATQTNDTESSDSLPPTP